MPPTTCSSRLLGQHLMCGSCAGRLQGDRCPTCREPLLKDRNRQLVPFRLVNQLVQEFEHACPNGLHLRGTAAQLEEHADQCEHRPDRCTFHSMGCPWHGKARDRPAHEADFNPHAGMFMAAMYRTCQFLESAKTDLHQTRAQINSLNREIDNLNGRSEIQMNLLSGIRATVDRAEASAEERLRAVEERLPRRANGDSERTAQRHRKTKLDLRNEVVAEVEAEVEARVRSEYEPKEKAPARVPGTGTWTLCPRPRRRRRRRATRGAAREATAHRARPAQPKASRARQSARSWPGRGRKRGRTASRPERGPRWHLPGCGRGDRARDLIHRLHTRQYTRGR